MRDGEGHDAELDHLERRHDGRGRHQKLLELGRVLLRELGRLGEPEHLEDLEHAPDLMGRWQWRLSPSGRS